ncbi:MAG: transposase [Bacteroidetes bacterium GWF2_43_63]|nr:MAG: transposase [Bacteroidetes bacterium GWE2_42_42]OFY52599.1 MAG: transposase [Bacteroidetes bacterium GWF2_43_63]HBG69871.1 IS200/IS605 family transposase [Bacteroidales bacterium]HCB62702.1 IS200/IS605 family transposase [Bacteroidales bacterium]HCY23536.1 IS200/IS605 family transposase [Bacteroidales bacterium]
MANTYTQLHIHIVFSVQNRMSFISPRWRDDLYKYITGIVQNNNHKLLAVGGMPDHIHLLIGFRPTQSLSNLVQDIKGDSSKWINQNRLVPGHFSWQEGFGAFSYRQTDVPSVASYVLNQEHHHRVKTFLQEYKELLEEFCVDYDDKYVFKSV